MSVKPRRGLRSTLDSFVLLTMLGLPGPLSAQTTSPGAPPSGPYPPPASGAPPDRGPPPVDYPPPGYDAQPGYAPPYGYYPTPGYASPYPPPAYYPPPGPMPPPAEMQSAHVAVAAQDATETTPSHAYAWGATLSQAFESNANSTSVVTSPMLTGAYAAHPKVLLSLAFGFGWLVDNQGLSESTFRAGNPQLSARYHVHKGGWNLHAGFGVTAPLAHVPLSPDGRLYAFIYNRTLAMGGMWDQWLWLAERMAVPATLRASYGFGNGFALLAENAEALVFGVRNGARGTDLVGQLAVEARIPVGETVTLCPRLQAVLLPEISIDRVQTAASLRAVVATRAGRFFAGLLVNIDEPVAAQRGIERWGFHLGRELEP